MFVHSFKAGDNDSLRNFNPPINNKPLFVQPINHKQESIEKIVEMSRYDNYTTGNLLDYLLV